MKDVDNRKRGIGLTHSERDRDYGRFQPHAVDISTRGKRKSNCSKPVENWQDEHQLVALYYFLPCAEELQLTEVAHS